MNLWLTLWIYLSIGCGISIAVWQIYASLSDEGKEEIQNDLDLRGVTIQKLTILAGLLWPAVLVALYKDRHNLRS